MIHVVHQFFDFFRAHSHSRKRSRQKRQTQQQRAQPMLSRHFDLPAVLWASKREQAHCGLVSWIQLCLEVVQIKVGVGGAREPTTEGRHSEGSSVLCGRRSTDTTATAPKQSKRGTRTAQEKPDEAGVIAAHNTATRQKNAISLRAEIKISAPPAFHDTPDHYRRLAWRGALHPFKCGSNSLNAADEDDRINS